MDTVKESVLKVDSGTLWEKNPMLHWAITHVHEFARMKGLQSYIICEQVAVVLPSLFSSSSCV